MAVPPHEIARLELEVRLAQQRLDAAHRENRRADTAWERTCAEADRMMAQGKTIPNTAEFILGAAARARAAMGETSSPKVIPFKGGMLTPEQLLAWTINNGVKPK